MTIKVTVSGLSTSTGIMLRSDGSLTADVLVRDQLANVGSLEKMTANLSVAVPISSVLKVNGELAGGHSVARQLSIWISFNVLS